MCLIEETACSRDLDIYSKQNTGYPIRVFRKAATIAQSKKVKKGILSLRYPNFSLNLCLSLTTQS